MFRRLEGVLNTNEIKQLRELAKTTRFVDGRATNRDNSAKHNLQVPQDDPSCEEPGRIVRDALFRHAEFARWVFPKQVARPTLSRYDEGMYYGRHCDEAVFPSKPQPMRSDASCTIFINDPEDYEGGELVLHLGPESVKVKYPAGDAVLYPTDAIHEVTKVTRGTRLVAITWVQSHIPDPKQREVLARYYGVVRKFFPEADEDMRLEMDYIRTSLFRMWTDL